MLPDPDRPEIAAWVLMGRARRSTVAAAALAAAIPRRHTNRRPYQDRPVCAAVLAELVVAGDREEATVVVADSAVRGLAATPLSQVVEVPRLRSLLGDQANGRVLQSVLRVGYPATGMRATPRRPLNEVMLP